MNYAATVGIAIAGFFALEVLFQTTLKAQLIIWIPFAVVFPVLFFRHSRSIWLGLDYILFNIDQSPPWT